MSLTEQQLQVLEIVHELKPESVALGGGAALIAAGFVDRRTRDLDFFSNDIEAIGPFADKLIANLEAHEFIVEVVTRTKGFVQLKAGGVLIDIAHNYLAEEPIQGTVGLRCGDADLIGGKIEALFTRRVNRDVVDVAQLLERFTMGELVELARNRDAGFSVPVTIEMTEGNVYDQRQSFEEQEFDDARAKVLSHLRDLVD